MSDNKTRRTFLQSMAVSGLTAGVVSSKDAFARQEAPIRSSYLSPLGNKYIDPRKVLIYE